MGKKDGTGAPPIVGYDSQGYRGPQREKRIIPCFDKEVHWSELQGGSDKTFGSHKKSSQIGNREENHHSFSRNGRTIQDSKSGENRRQSQKHRRRSKHLQRKRQNHRRKQPQKRQKKQNLSRKQQRRSLFRRKQKKGQPLKRLRRKSS